MPFLSVVIPVYNEAKRLPKSLGRLQNYLKKQSYSYEVLVVDDGSTDQTAKVVQEYQVKFPALKLITNSQNQGKGAVVRQGMLQATGDWRLFMDADYSTPAEELDKLLPWTKDFSVIIGSRRLPDSIVTVKRQLRRRIISRLSNTLIQLFLVPGIQDTQCGFKLFSAQAAGAIFPLQQMGRWSFDIEVLTIARQLGFAIKEVGVEWTDDRDSKFRALQGMGPFISDLWQIYRKSRRGYNLES